MGTPLGSIVKFLILPCLVLAAFICRGEYQEIKFEDFTPPELKTIRSDIEKSILAGHPRLFASRSDFEELKTEISNRKDSLKAIAARRVCEHAEFLLTRKHLTRTMVGRRLLQHCRKALNRISVLSMAYKITGEKKFVDRAIEELTAVCGYKDWNPAHFLDVGEMCLAVSIGYDWLYDELTEEKRAEIRKALYEKGLVPTYTDKRIWWKKAQNNWGQVCRAGLIVASLTIADDPSYREAAAKMIDESIRALPYSMKAIAPDGCYPEGPGYWHYGMSFNVFLIAALESAFGTDYGISNLEGFWKSGDYPNTVTGPSGYTFGYSDGTSNRGYFSVLWWYAKKLNRPDLPSETEVKHFQNPLPRVDGGWLPPLELFWMDGREPGVVPYKSKSVWAPEGKVPIAILRSGAEKDSSFVGIKGGSPSMPHGHMDGGNFILEMGGIRWAWELRSENYTRIERMKEISLWDMSQKSTRWALFRLNADGHNVPQIDGQPQLVGGSANFIEASEKPSPRAKIDLTSLYANAGKVTRSYILSNDGKNFEVRDEFEGVRPGAEIVWKFITKAKGSVKGGHLELSQEGRALDVVRTGTAASDWNFGKAEGGKPWDSKNDEFALASFKMKADADGKAVAVVRFSLR
ncbi:MAG: DUF4962 domain-containing protein [Kiritimatiellae bacterium]|nr:DUF4962 domain-containing protein [Kiritimatiellia bacterium]